MPVQQHHCLTVTLPVPIGLNGTGDQRGAYAIATVRGVPRLVTSRRARQWRKEAAFLVSSAAREQEWEDPGGPLAIVVTRGDRSDIDSGTKLLLDGIADGLGIDDARFVDLEVHRLRGVVPADCVIVGVGEAMP